jgi:hypothetical protein
MATQSDIARLAPVLADRRDTLQPSPWPKPLRG